MILSEVNKIIPKAFAGKLKLVFILSIISLLLDFISVVLLVPIFMGIFNSELHLGTAGILGIASYLGKNTETQIAGIVVFYIFKNILSVRIIKYQSDYYYKLSNQLSVDLLRNYFGKSMLEVKSEKNSALVKDIIFIPNNFVAYVLTSIIQLTSEWLLLILIFIAAFFISIPGAIFLAAMTALLVITLYFYDKKQVSNINETVSDQYNHNFANLLNAVNGYAEIKINGLERFFLEKFSISNSALNKMYGKLTTARLSKPKYTETLLIILIAGLWLFSRTQGSGNIVFIAFLFAASIKIIPSVNRILASLTSLKSNMYTIDILKMTNSIPDGEPINASFGKSIELRKVSFRFGEKKILDNVSLDIKKGEIIGVFGESGAGKSTFVNIVSGLIIPDSGAIYSDDQTISPISLRGLLSYVPQSPFIFEASIRENIYPGDSATDDARLQKFLELTELKEIIDALPNKLDTFIGSNGYKLSGGQLQRLAIVRALVRNPQILILDEATNQLDIRLRTNLGDRIKELAGELNMTVIAISHNKAELERFCDTIFELKNAILNRIQ